MATLLFARVPALRPAIRSAEPARFEKAQTLPEKRPAFQLRPAQLHTPPTRTTFTFILFHFLQKVFL
ncbi:hypothetical protein AOLI_G00241500 [Acnodon oligacanthus]